jgi:hypothetical protein
MVARNIFWKKHIAAFVITFLIFVIGLLIGLKISDSRLTLLEDFNQQQRSDFESLQLQYAYLTSSNGSCSAFEETLGESVSDLENARIKMENYLQSSYDSDDFLDEKRDYMLAEIRYWMLARQTEIACGKHSVNILYFYESDDVCSKCSTQGYVLTSLKDKFKDKLLVFSLDASSDEPMVKIIKNVYNLEDTPSIVIDDEVISGFTSEDQLISLICLHFDDTTVCDNL